MNNKNIKLKLKENTQIPKLNHLVFSVADNKLIELSLAKSILNALNDNVHKLYFSVLIKSTLEEMIEINKNNNHRSCVLVAKQCKL